MENKLCMICGLSKSISDFCITVAGNVGSRCVVCVRKFNALKSAKYRSVNPLRHKLLLREWKDKNRDRIRQLDREKYARHPEKKRENERLRRKRNPDKFLEKDLQRYCNITLVEYNNLLTRQEALCAICRKPPVKKRLAVDHCHKTGKIRGLLCDACNTSLGKFHDNPSIIRAAAEYVENGGL